MALTVLNKIGTASILDNAITSSKIIDNAITSGKIIDNAITSGKIINNAVTASKIVAGAAGKVLQVVSITKTDTQSITGTTFVDVFSLAITPLATSSKIFLHCSINLSANGRYSALKTFRDSTQINMGNQIGSNRSRVSVSSQTNNDATNDSYIMHNSSTSFLDSPNTTSQITYKIKCGNTNDNATVSYINRPHSDSDNAFVHAGSSTFTLMEVAG